MLANWYETDEHVESLKKHLNPITVRDMLLFFIYSHELKKVNEQFSIGSFGRWSSYLANRRILKHYKKDLKIWSDHIKKVKENVGEVTKLTNIGRKGDVPTDTTLVNWYADLVTFFNRYMNTTEEQVLNMPYVAVNEYKVAIARLMATERKVAISNQNANEDTLTSIDAHIKRLSSHAREVRALNAQAARADFMAH